MTNRGEGKRHNEGTRHNEDTRHNEEQGRNFDVTKVHYSDSYARTKGGKELAGGSVRLGSGANAVKGRIRETSKGGIKGRITSDGREATLRVDPNRKEAKLTNGKNELSYQSEKDSQGRKTRDASYDSGNRRYGFRSGDGFYIEPSQLRDGDRR
jgi:hypothetical protein